MGTVTQSATCSAAGQQRAKVQVHLNKMKIQATAVFVVLAALYFQDTESLSCSCEVTYQAVGCYKDKESDRALEDYILTEREKGLKISNGKLINWGEYKTYIPEFVCRCAQAAKKLGHTHFGVQYYGECWSSNNAADSFSKHGKDGGPYEENGRLKGCIGGDFKACKSSEHCIGREYTNYVYKIAQECNNKVERVGCFKDVRKSNALTNQILTDRDKFHRNFSGVFINWAWFDSYFSADLLCRCAAAAKKEGYTVFGLQYYGECWGSKDGLEQYAKYEESSNCIDNCYKQCGSAEKYCIGKQNANFVYRFALTEESCAVPHENVGCLGGIDILTELLITDKPSSSKFTGHSHMMTPTPLLSERFPELACSCSVKAKEKGFQFFGLKSTGDCYGGNGINNGNDLNDGASVSSDCYNDWDKQEQCNSDMCVGGDSAWWVMKVDAVVKKRDEIKSKVIDDDFIDELVDF